MKFRNASREYIALVILALALMVRFYHLQAPLIGVHSWRQADTAAVARNFNRNGYRIFYPQIDWGGNSSGLVEMEFPIYPFLVSLFYKIWGVSELFGRLLSIVFSLITIMIFYLLVQQLIDRMTALWSCVFLGVLPFTIYYSRTFMPEAMLMMSLVAGIYFFVQWLNNSQWKYLWSSAAFVALSCLIKIPSLYIGLPLLYLAWLRFGKKIYSQITLWGYGLVILGLTGVWYFHAHQLFLQSGLTFGIWDYGSDKWGNWISWPRGGFGKTFFFYDLGLGFWSYSAFRFSWLGYCSNE